MSLALVDYLTWIKRTSGYGGSPVITGVAAAQDKPTLDILTSFNARRNRIWAKTDWSWQREVLSIPMVVGTTVYAVTAASGNSIDRIYNLIPNDPTAVPPVSGRALRQRTEREFYNEIAGADPTTQAIPIKYYNMGRVNGVWNVKVWPAPSAAFKMGGSAKGILNTFLIGDVTGVAPFSPGNTIAAINPPLDYFPNGVLESCLFDGIMSDVFLTLKQFADAKAYNDSFEAKLKLLAAEEAEASKDNTPITSPLPAVVRRRRARGRGCW